MSNHPKIIVGPAFAKYNRFIANKNVNIKFFISNKIYNINDKYADEIIYEDINIGNIENNEISINSVSPFTSWGLFVEESKELFFVVNSMDIKEIYINFKLYGV